MSLLLLQSQPAMGAAFYSGLFAKYGATTGWFVHGGAGRSKFYQDSAGTVLAASTGDRATLEGTLPAFVASLNLVM